MSILDRWIESTLDRLGYTKRSAQPPPVVFGGEAPLSDRADYGSMSQEKLERMAVQSSWVYSDIQLIGRQCSLAELEVLRQDGEGLESIEAHPFERLMRRPHKYFSGAFLLQYTIWWLLLRGEAYWWQVGDQTGELSALVPMPASRMRPIPDPNDYIRGFAYRSKRRGNEIEIPVEQVCWFRFPNPFDYHRGLAPLSAYQMAMATDREAAQWNADSYEKGSPLRQVIGLPDTLNKDTYQRAKADLKREIAEGMRYIIARSGQINIADIGLGQKDMEYLAGREFTREEIDRVFGIPAGYWAKEATRANSEAAKASLMEGAIWPLLTMIHDTITAWIVQPHYGEDLVARFEDVRVADRDLELREREQAEHTRTLNEARLTRGESAYEGPMAEVIGQLPVPLATSPEFVLAATGIAMPRQEPVATQPIATQALDDMDKWERVALRRLSEGKALGEYDFVSEHIPDAIKAETQAALELCETEDDIAEVFRRYRGDLKKKTRKAVDRGAMEGRIERAVRHVFIQYEDLAKEAVGQGRRPAMERFGAKLRAALRPYMETISTERVLELAGEVGVQFDSAFVNVAAADWAREHTYDLVRGLNETTNNVIQRALTTVIENPEMDLQEVPRLLEPAFGRTRAEMIGITETTRAYAQATNYYQEQLAEQGVKLTQVWHTAADDRVCPICGPMDGKPQKDWPTSLSAGPPAHPRCRCWTTLTGRKLGELREEHNERQRLLEQELEEFAGA